ncbi:MAG: hypothetical protein IPK99_00230 [Flavobacteriales bacterium]|nr:hypothetical protein [Flavobacteriales bacterium]
MRIWTTPLLLIAVVPSNAQDQRQPLLAELNTLYRGEVKFRIDKDDRLVADFFDASGHFRQDAVYIEYLDSTGFRFNAEENAVVMNCNAANANCIEKEIFKLNVIRHTGRSNFPVPRGDSEGRNTITTLGRLVGQVQVEMARVAAETHARPMRKK